jgi:hypothetical protein
MLSLVISGCGTKDSPNSPVASNASKAAVFGIASLDATATSTVSVMDSSTPAQEKTAAIDSKGDFTVDASGLTPPFILKAEGTDQAGNGQTLYSVSKNGGRANINPLSDTAVAASADDAGQSAASIMRSGDDERRRTTDNFETVIRRLRTVLAPLFALYQVSGNAVSDDDDDDDNDNSGLRAMFRDVRFVVSDRRVTVTNRLTGGVIYSGRLSDLSSGTFYPENMPAGPGGSTACAYTYDAWSACQSNGTQTRNVLTSSPAGCVGTPVTSQACTYVPPAPAACTSFTYSAWGACLSTGTQLRSLLSSSPAGCAGGTPVLTQSCTYVPPAPVACTSFTYSAFGACQSNNTQTRSLLTSSPAGCVGGTPVLSQACTYVPPTTTCTSFTYSAFGACQSNNTQTRSLLTSSPAGCTGGTPVLTQACTYVPPVTTCTSFTYSAFGACQSNNTQTRSLLTSSPAGCAGGTPVLSQSCTYVPPTPVCGSCHAIPPSSGAHSRHVNSQGIPCSTCHGAGYSSTAVTAATHMNGVTNVVTNLNFNGSTCGSPGCHGSRSWLVRSEVVLTQNVSNHQWACSRRPFFCVLSMFDSQEVQVLNPS